MTKQRELRMVGAKEAMGMQYANMVQGVFLTRPNRFVANIEIEGRIQVCHVKNTGRCRELLTPGAAVWCQYFDNPSRKTAFDLIAVQKSERLINMDSQAPNKAVGEFLAAGGLGEISNLKAECAFGNSRFDFSFEKAGKHCFLEVKGVTLENDGVCAFPDAPTARGVKHLQELLSAVQMGYGAYVLFVVQMVGVKYLRPNDATDPAFGKVLRQAVAGGVEVLAMDCTVTPESMTLRQVVPVRL